VEAQTTGYQLSINLIAVIVLLSLFLFGLGYAWLVRWLRSRKADHGYTAILVAVGDLVVAVGFGILVGIDLAVLLLLCLGAAGLPMIIEYTQWYLNHEEKGGLDI
jgi:hypothetical protein